MNGHSYLLILVSIDSDDPLSCAMTSAKEAGGQTSRLSLPLTQLDS